jgi:hypothetical protein
MAIIRQGEILTAGSPRQAIDGLKDSVWEASVPPENVSALKARCQVVSSYMLSGMAQLRVIAKGERPGEEFMPAVPALEDYYFELISSPARAK